MTRLRKFGIWIVGVVEKKQSDKSIKEITLKDNRYEVRLPFKGIR